MITVSNIEEIKDELSAEFPDAVRGSVSKSRWGRGRRQLHLAYWIGSDSVGGYMITAKQNLFYFIEWNTNEGSTYLFAESTIKDMVLRVKRMFYGQQYKIDRVVGELTKQTQTKARYS